MSKKKRYFQWIAGEQLGDVVTLEYIDEFEGEVFYHFDDDDCCNQRFIAKMTNSVVDLKNKFMVEIESPSNPWTTETIKPRKYVDESMKGQDIEIPTLHDILQGSGENTTIENSDIGRQKLIPPKNPQRFIDLPKMDDYPYKSAQPVKQQETQVDQKEIVETSSEKHNENSVDTFVEVPKLNVNNTATININDPIRILVNTCKKHDTPIDLSLNMNLPSKYIYNIAANEFEDGVDKFIDCIVSDIDVTMIIDQLKAALKTAYSETDSEN